MKKVNEDKFVNFVLLYELDQPMDKTEEYDRVIEMLKMEVSEVVEISQGEFRNFVQDKWDWTERMLISNTKYLK